jgi:hypothetical protein
LERGKAIDPDFAKVNLEEGKRGRKEEGRRIEGGEAKEEKEGGGRKDLVRLLFLGDKDRLRGRSPASLGFYIRLQLLVCTGSWREGAENNERPEEGGRRRRRKEDIHSVDDSLVREPVHFLIRGLKEERMREGRRNEGREEGGGKEGRRNEGREEGGGKEGRRKEEGG